MFYGKCEHILAPALDWERRLLSEDFCVSVASLRIYGIYYVGT